MITGGNYIGDEISKQGTHTYQTFNPKLNLPTPWTFHEATAQEVKAACDLAAEAFVTYKKCTGSEKAKFLRQIALEIEALGDALISTYMQESGLPEGRANGERGRTLGQLNAFADSLEEGSWVEATIDTAKPDRQPIPKVDLRKMLMPIGPIAVFGSSNFPLAFSTAGGDAASALAAGCPVIVKSHPMHSGTGELVASAITTAIEKTGMPKGVFSNLNSSGIAVGEQLVMNDKIKGVGFTGSIKGGTAIYKLANGREEPIPVFAEMGSVNPVIVLPSALEEKGEDWAKKYAGSILLGAGQFCTNPGLLLALKSTALDGFISTLGAEISKAEPICMLHPKIHENFENGKDEMSRQDTVDVVAAYEENAPPNFAKQKVLTVNGSDFLRNTKLHQEVFGPFSIVVRCEDSEELKAIIKKLDGQLTGTVLGSTDELNTYNSVVDSLQNRVGRIIFNGVPTGVEVCPSMQHGGPFPATTDSRFTSVGTSSIKRWVRPVTYQSWPQNMLPKELQDTNPLKVVRIVNGVHTSNKI
jgi:NADP-dependent aldehyde dehydrogenase